MENNQDLAELQELLKEYKYIVDSSMEAIFITHKEHCIELNEAGRKLYKFATKEEAIGQHAYKFIAPNSHQIIRENIARKNLEPFEAYAIKNDGTLFPVLVKIKTTKRRGKEIRIINVLDLTEIKHKDFIIANQSKMAALGEMVENIAHQWRQPLNAITTSVVNLQIAKELGEPLSEESEAEYLENIIESAKYLSNTINDFRNFVKSSSKKSDIILQESIDESLTIARATLQSHFIEVIKAYEEEPIVLKSNASELSQIILNIINNAKDALIEINPEHKKITISVTKKENAARVTIEDNAGGIPDEVLPKIFDPYFSTKKDKNGTGIGLYMSKELISKHLNGTLYAKNSDEGAKFFIELPL